MSVHPDGIAYINGECFPTEEARLPIVDTGAVAMSLSKPARSRSVRSVEQVSR